MTYYAFRPVSLYLLHFLHFLHFLYFLYFLNFLLLLLLHLRLFLLHHLLLLLEMFNFGNAIEFQAMLCRYSVTNQFFFFAFFRVLTILKDHFRLLSSFLGLFQDFYEILWDSLSGLKRNNRFISNFLSFFRILCDPEGSFWASSIDPGIISGFL